MRRVLMLSYYFPPLGGIGSIRALKFARYLPEFGWDPTVIAPRNGAYYRDPTLQFDEKKVIRTASLEISRAGKWMIGAERDDTRPADVGSALERVRRLVRRWIYRPDPQVGWYPFAVRCGRQLIRERKFDAIFSSSFPITAHLVARRLYRDFGVPWVAEFRDLWTDQAEYDSRRRESADERTERVLLEAATEVVTVSQSYAELFLKRGARRVTIITNGFDPVDFPGASNSNGFVVTYLGTYYADRQDLRTALRALGDLVRSGSLPGLTVRVIGDCPESLRTIVAEEGLADEVHCTGFVPYREALRLLSESKLLLLAGPVSTTMPGRKLRGHIAAKVFEYLGSGRPILYVGKLDADVVTILRSYPGVACVEPGDTEGAREGILDLIGQGSMVDRESLGPYTRRSLAGRLAEVLNRACAGNDEVRY
jgi:glycosyltransferase involved in cell wall biosynthesis